MKILIVNDSFPPENIGGASKVALDMATGFKGLGHEVLIVTTTSNFKNVGRSDYDGLAVMRLYSNYKTKFLRSYFAVYNPLLVRELSSVFKDEKPDVIHFHNIHSNISFGAIKMAKKSGVKKVFLTAHDVISFSYTRLYHFINPSDPECKIDYDYRIPLRRLITDAGKAYNPFRNIMIRHYLSYCDKIFAVSGALKKALNQNGITNVDVVYNGIDSDEFGSSVDVDKLLDKFNLRNKKIIFFGGRGMSGKGGDVLIKAFYGVIKKVPDAVLCVAMDLGKYTLFLEKLANELNLARNIIFPGILKGKEYSSMLALADLAVVPSTCFDSAPLMVMQAMAAGKPVVGTCFGGTPEIIEDGVTGFIVNPYNIALMSDKIIQILNDNNLEKQMGARGLERVKERFNLNRQIKDTLEYYLK